MRQPLKHSCHKDLEKVSGSELSNKEGNFPDSLIIENGRSFEIFTEFVGNKDAATLDVGCGNGEFLKTLTDHGYRNLFAADLENQLAFAAPKQFMELDLSYDKLPVPDASFNRHYRI
jgi:2-polyprenyl-3-methyl-5-hydroxy-6-metoxy-1,4-benzoquinol methylase